MTDRPSPGAKGSIWHPTIDALCFRPLGHDGLCFVHRLAFRSLMGRDPHPSACEDWFRRERQAFEAAAARKIGAGRLQPEANFHLTSRDIGRETRPAPT